MKTVNDAQDMHKLHEHEFTTPMMQQYAQIKKQYPDCLLFFRLGDFYELFMDDALIGAKILDITLTGRPRGKDGRIPMSGVPFHAVDAYLPKLVKAGYKVAICEQITEPDKYGIVERAVIRVVTPGTLIDEKALGKENNYIMTLVMHNKKIGIAVADISTGEFKTGEIQYAEWEKTITDELIRIMPTECILKKKEYDNPKLMNILARIPGLNIFCFHNWENIGTDYTKYLRKELQIKSLITFGLEEKQAAQEATAGLYAYLKETQKNNLIHIQTIKELHDENRMRLDKATIMNLELFAPLRETHKTGTLIAILDKTKTAMGGRLLKDWILRPLNTKQEIQYRLDQVTELIHNFELKEQIDEHLNLIPDIERILARIAIGTGNPRDCITIKNALINACQINKKLKSAPHIFTHQILNEETEKEIHEIIKTIEKTIQDDPPFETKEGGIIKEGVHEDLDKLRKQNRRRKECIASLEKTERERTGIQSLKVRFNKVFGFYIEVTNANIANVPQNYVRKQTLANGERYTTKELKEQEEKIITAEEKINRIEFELFQQVEQKIIALAEQIQQCAKNIAHIDCILNLANIAITNNYVRPQLTNENEIKIEDGRHPVVEKMLEDTQFIPNSINIGGEYGKLHIITGPNMAGKSVFMRQVALITLMAHIGSYVPAKKAKIALTDSVFVRSTASDMISAGLSTFMVEMVEMAYILKHATQKSLIIVDEIGRGTSTYDGISLAWAIAEYIVTQKELQTKTLFATHYHELQKLEEEYPKAIKNFHMAMREVNGQPVFLYQLQPKGAEHSFGIEVAKLAGMPDHVINKAKEIAHTLESRSENVDVKITNNENKKDEQKETGYQFPSEHSVIIDELHELDIHHMTPMQAINKLAEIKNKIKILNFKVIGFMKAD